ncbi:ABC transporter permease [Citricoccus sp. SGAir0253]|uniref:FtsX-like permease family protein n=1 Tax=Citricoccus sp. SGAir0253 TaxID=2567881 RepID=UPI0010CCD9EB|nr:ABC transporter permease [Citricoccus sp. SGAir0253]QCU79114.1 ABC transporter permease [Citricoccus sp. SGAir0253]
MLTLALSQLRDRPRRYVSVLLAIVIGVTFLASALLVGSSATASLRNSLGATYSAADLVVAPAPGADFETGVGLAAAAGTPAGPGSLQDVEGVREAHAHVVTAAGLQRPSGREGTGSWSETSDFALVSTVPRDTTLVPAELVAGGFPAPGSATEIVLDERTARSFGLAVGSSTYLIPGVEADSPGRRVTVAGIAEVSQDPNAIGAIQVRADEALTEALKADALAALRSLEGAVVDGPEAREQAAAAEMAEALAADHAEHVLVRLADGADPARVAAALREAAEDRGLDVTVATPDVQAQEQVARMAGSNVFAWVLGAFAAIALLVTALVIANTFSVLVAQRSRDLALQRALGASTRQVRGSVLAEAGVVGLLGSLVGVGLAAALVAGLVAWGATAEGFGFLTFEAAPLDLVTCVAVGVGLTVLASSAAAGAATRVSPLEAMRPREDAAVGNRAGTVRLVLGTLALLAGAAGLVGGAVQANLAIAVAGGALSFVGVLMLAVLFVPAVVSVAGLAARPAGVPGRMARLNAVRNPGRTASTAAALLIGTTLVAMMLTGGRTAQVQMDTIFRAEFPVDVQVRLDPDGGAAERDRVVAVEGVDAAALLVPAGTARPAGTGGGGAAEGGTAGGEAAVYAADPEQLRAVVAGLPADAAERLGESGTVLVPNTVEADALVVTGPAGSRTFDVVASASSALVPVIPLADARALGLDPGAAGAGASVGLPEGPAPQLWLRADEGLALDALQELNTEVAQAAGVTQDSVSGELALRLLFTVVIDGMLMVVTALLAVSVLIALVGVANTLSLSAIERSRENSLMRALGLTRGGLRGMLALEAVLVSGVAALVGCVLGTVYGGFGAHTVFGPMAAGIGQPVVWPVVPWPELALIVVVSVAAGLLASVAPSRRAARLSPVQGLATA